VPKEKKEHGFMKRAERIKKINDEYNKKKEEEKKKKEEGGEEGNDFAGNVSEFFERAMGSQARERVEQKKKADEAYTEEAEAGKKKKKAKTRRLLDMFK
jgi:hypothetical protein